MKKLFLVRMSKKQMEGVRVIVRCLNEKQARKFVNREYWSYCIDSVTEIAVLDVYSTETINVI